MVQINQIEVHEQIKGNGDTILLLHGWGANIELLEPLAKELRSCGYLTVMMDLPGFGKTPEPPAAWTVFDYADFVIDYMNYHQLEDVYLFGHSFGGRLSLILGADHASRIRKIALADSAGIVSKSPLTNRLRLGTYKSIRGMLESIGADNTAQSLRKWYGDRYGSSDYQQVSGIMRETFVKVVNQDLLSYAERVTIPTLLFWGDQDEETPLWQGKTLEQTIPDAGLIVYEGAGHYSYLDKLHDTVRIMDHFFRND